jgi:hypothetical protein
MVEIAQRVLLGVDHLDIVEDARLLAEDCHAHFYDVRASMG